MPFSDTDLFVFGEEKIASKVPHRINRQVNTPEKGGKKLQRNNKKLSSATESFWLQFQETYRQTFCLPFFFGIPFSEVCHSLIFVPCFIPPYKPSKGPLKIRFHNRYTQKQAIIVVLTI